MRDADIRVSDAELQLLKLLWIESPQAAVDLAEHVKQSRGWSLTTVKTLLARLVAKGAVRAEAEGRRFLYHPVVARETVAATEADRLLHRLFGGRVPQLVAHLAERQRLSDEDIAEIQALFRELKS